MQSVHASHALPYFDADIQALVMDALLKYSVCWQTPRSLALWRLALALTSPLYGRLPRSCKPHNHPYVDVKLPLGIYVFSYPGSTCSYL